MKVKFFLFLSIMLIILTNNCSTTPEPVQAKPDPMAELNAELKPARLSGYEIGSNAPSKAKLAEWDKNFLPIVKGVYDKMPEGYKLQVRGNADASGSNQENMEVGEKRAKYVYDYLLKKGFKANKLIAVSKGEESLMESEKDPLDVDHRRVNFRVVKE
ncbi:MAG: OmpA family protein [Leptospiraceae bacterium]|nr:OmpA family protein [Leptospiraceae bacterium]MBK9500162.1 OmpA family protein [Leptospiraceae bacterium]